MDIKQLRDKATTFGFTFDKHPIKRGSGYVLIDPDGNKPLGDDYTASLSDIARHLETFADDDDIEGGISEPNKPPSSAAIKKAIAGHNDASAVKEALKPLPPITGLEIEAKASSIEERRRRMALDGLLAVTNGPQRMAFDKLSEADKQSYMARVREMLDEDQRLSDAKVPKSPLPLRSTGLNADHPLAIERARQGRIFAEANRKLSRTNISSLKDGDDDSDRTEHTIRKYAVDEYGNRQFLHEKAFLAAFDVEEPFLPPEPDADYAPKIGTGFAIQTKRQAARRDHAPKISDGLAELKQDAALRRLAASINSAIDGKDFPRAGDLLTEAKAMLGHGQFTPWLERSGIHKRTAQRCLKAKSDN